MTDWGKGNTLRHFVMDGEVQNSLIQYLETEYPATARSARASYLFQMPPPLPVGRLAVPFPRSGHEPDQPIGVSQLHCPLGCRVCCAPARSLVQTTLPPCGGFRHAHHHPPIQTLSGQHPLTKHPGRVGSIPENRLGSWTARFMHTPWCQGQPTGRRFAVYWPSVHSHNSSPLLAHRRPDLDGPARP